MLRDREIDQAIIRLGVLERQARYDRALAPYTNRIRLANQAMRRRQMEHRAFQGKVNHNMREIRSLLQLIEEKEGIKVKGSALIVAMVVLFILLICTAGLFNLTQGNIYLAKRDAYRAQVFYTSEAGIEVGRSFLANANFDSPPEEEESLLTGNIPGKGSYKVYLRDDPASDPDRVILRSVANYQGIACTTHAVVLRTDSIDLTTRVESFLQE